MHLNKRVGLGLMVAEEPGFQAGAGGHRLKAPGAIPYAFGAGSSIRLST